MNGNKQVVAIFKQNLYLLSVTTNGSGIVARIPAKSGYTHGEQVTLAVVPTAGWHFVRWEGATTGTNNTVTVEMVENKALVAVFEPN